MFILAMGAESAIRSDHKMIWPALGLCAAHITLVGGMAAVFFGDEPVEGWAAAAAPLAVMLLLCGGCLFAGCTRKVFEYDHTSRRLSLCCALCCCPLIIVGIITADFEHVDNNYANKSMPVGGPGSGSGPDDPQYFDCHERTSGLYPAYLATALCVVLSPLYAALEPEYGVKCMRGMSWEQKNREAEEKRTRAWPRSKDEEAAAAAPQQQ